MAVLAAALDRHAQRDEAAPGAHLLDVADGVAARLQMALPLSTGREVGSRNVRVPEEAATLGLAPRLESRGVRLWTGRGRLSLSTQVFDDAADLDEFGDFGASILCSPILSATNLWVGPACSLRWWPITVGVDSIARRAAEAGHEGLDVERVVLGGGVGQAAGYLDRVARALEREPASFRPSLESAALGSDAALHGVLAAG